MAGCGGDNGPAVSATLNAPHGVAVDAGGNLYIAEAGGHRVRMVTPGWSDHDAGGQRGGELQRGWGAGGGEPTEQSAGVGGGRGGHLYVADAGNHRIRMITSKQAQTIGAITSNPTTLVYSSGGQFTVTAIASSSLATTFTSLTLGVCTTGGTNGQVVAILTAGTCSIAADQAGNEEFSPAARVTQSFNISKAGQVISFATLPDRTVGTAPFAISATSSSGLTVTFMSLTTPVCTVSGSTVSVVAGGTCSIAADQAGNVNYLAAPRVTRGFTVSLVLNPANDDDFDGIPNGVELTEGRNPLAKDNDVFGNARLFAMQMYRDFLNREGDLAGIQGWTDLINGGTYTRLQVINAFLLSDEFAGFVSPVVRLYFATYLRVPDYDGLTFNAGLVRNGTVTLQQLADFFTASPEFAALYGSLDNPAFVTLLYGNVLDRAPDPAGLSGWVALLNGGYTRGQVLLGFSDSAEYQSAMANEVFVTMMYSGMLRRTPEPSGFTGWVNFLDAGTYTREQVINGFFLSTEYRARFLPD